MHLRRRLTLLEHRLRSRAPAWPGVFARQPFPAAKGAGSLSGTALGQALLALLCFGTRDGACPLVLDDDWDPHLPQAGGMQSCSDRIMLLISPATLGRQ